MRSEINETIVTIFDDKNIKLLEQDFDPRDGNKITSKKQAKDVAEYLLSILEQEIIDRDNNKLEPINPIETAEEKIAQLEKVVADIYVKLIESKISTIDDVPDSMKESVTAAVKFEGDA